MPHLLFVDDDLNILKINRDYFERCGYKVTVASDPVSALKYAKSNPIDCIILDILMPEVNGFDVCKKIKEQTTAPVIFLTCLTQKEYLYQGFSLGGDDFLTKPYDLKELEIRIHTRINQHSGHPLRKECLSFPPLTIDTGARRATIDHVDTCLTSNEFDILLLLARHPGQVFSPGAIYREVWKLPDLDNAQTVKVHVARMRHKLEEACPGRKYIGTIWKQGYQFIADRDN